MLPLWHQASAHRGSAHALVGAPSEPQTALGALVEAWGPVTVFASSKESKALEAALQRELPGGILRRFELDQAEQVLTALRACGRAWVVFGVTEPQAFAQLSARWEQPLDAYCARLSGWLAGL